MDRSSIDWVPFLKEPDSVYVFGRVLGKGSFGAVYLATYLPTGEDMAVKVFEKACLDKDMFISELAIQRKLVHPNVVAFKHVHESSDKFFLGMELVAGGRLSDLIRDRLAKNAFLTNAEAS